MIRPLVPAGIAAADADSVAILTQREFMVKRAGYCKTLREADIMSVRVLFLAY